MHLTGFFFMKCNEYDGVAVTFQICMCKVPILAGSLTVTGSWTWRWKPCDPSQHQELFTQWHNTSTQNISVFTLRINPRKIMYNIWLVKKYLIDTVVIKIFIQIKLYVSVHICCFFQFIVLQCWCYVTSNNARNNLRKNDSTWIWKQAVINHMSVLCQSTAVAQLVEALRYKPEGRGFDFRWCLWNFSLT